MTDSLGGQVLDMDVIINSNEEMPIYCLQSALLRGRASRTRCSSGFQLRDLERLSSLRLETDAAGRSVFGESGRRRRTEQFEDGLMSMRAPRFVPKSPVHHSVRASGRSLWQTLLCISGEVGHA